jgi:mannose-6-phosphate isomerase-like protein (cupin superfamily)
MSDEVNATEAGEGWAVSSLDAMGQGPGFRKVRSEVWVNEFGINAIVMPPGYSANAHWHDRQEELYFVHSGRIDIAFGDTVKRLGPGGFARVDARTVRQISNPGDVEAVYVIVGAEGGYVGRDGHMVEDTDPAHDGQRGEGGANPAEADAQL